MPNSDKHASKVTLKQRLIILCVALFAPLTIRESIRISNQLLRENIVK